MTLQLQDPFAEGGNRLCFVHPENPERCIKVRRPDFSLEERRRQKGFPKNLKPLSRFDDNREEAAVMTGLARRYGEPIYRHVSRCYGFVATSHGPGLISELIRNEDGTIASTLKKLLWDRGMTPECDRAIGDLCSFWEKLAVPSRDLLLHNLVVEQTRSGASRIVVIDGLGSSSLIPLALLPSYFARAKARRKVKNLRERIDGLLEARHTGVYPGLRGLLLHDGRVDPQDKGP
ncbi:YrbL family protein [Hydrocarboniclastica marina]|uniref:PhoP regulatory network protein YrbL n=1 Tax=Hydrocarboniclastica marina TaxID=2259620 RepID=A0A4P7XEI2_9ALTE|nr:YrbL family protein [Hydrocarboniclastica marina]MAL99566.1 hypothetical protein [Alteromonadaceae bacterium]QCF25025.1 hypothetical protein soil367_03205 [Hydrocarboniclastica marina]|tara:strand:+ start:2192 stop:2890 length:699 start_codon:yes stop_codon:yes gene_type:complete